MVAKTTRRTIATRVSDGTVPRGPIVDIGNIGTLVIISAACDPTATAPLRTNSHLFNTHYYQLTNAS